VQRWTKFNEEKHVAIFTRQKKEACCHLSKRGRGGKCRPMMEAEMGRATAAEDDLQNSNCLRFRPFVARLRTDLG
jgi:hypothetical protein